MTQPGPGPARHAPPPPGAPQPGAGAPTGRAGFVDVNGRLFAPLQGLDPADVLQGGYGWLDVTDGGATYHPGVDLNSGGSCNADEGVLVVTPLACWVRATIAWDGSPGEGNHVWLEVDSPDAPAPTWVHYDHLQAVDCRTGQRLEAGELVGTCGRTGGWDCAHLHTELLPAAPAGGWFQWPYGWSRAQVQAAYYDPASWWAAASAKAQGAPEEAVVAILSGAQAAAVQAVVWGRYWDAAASDHAIEASWRDEWRRGVWRGAPLSDEQLVPDDPAAGAPAGAWRLFEQGVAAWLPGQAVSWDG